MHCVLVVPEAVMQSWGTAGEVAIPVLEWVLAIRVDRIDCRPSDGPLRCSKLDVGHRNATGNVHSMPNIKSASTSIPNTNDWSNDKFPNDCKHID